VTSLGNSFSVQTDIRRRLKQAGEIFNTLLLRSKIGEKLGLLTHADTETTFMYSVNYPFSSLMSTIYSRDSREMALCRIEIMC